MKHMIKFTAQELVLLEKILNRPIKHIFGLWTGKEFVYGFEPGELEEMARIVYQAQTESFDSWLDMLHEQQQLYPGHIKPTEEMRKQWKYTGQIEEIYDRIAVPIGKSHRCSPEEEKEMMEYFDSLEPPELLEGLEPLEASELLEGWNLWKRKE